MNKFVLFIIQLYSRYLLFIILKIKYINIHCVEKFVIIFYM